MGLDGCLFANVLLPLKLDSEITYFVPEKYSDEILTGSFVKVTFKGKECTAVILSLYRERPLFKGEIKEIDSLLPFDPVPETSIRLLLWIASYYMCTPGEVLRAAIPKGLLEGISKKKKIKAEVETAHFSLPKLSKKQNEAFLKIKETITQGKTALLKGVTGSGKTEIYLSYAAEVLSAGRNVLYLLPEIALSRQLKNRLEKVFGQSLLVFHSGQTAASKRDVWLQVMCSKSPYIVLGLRSAVFLPYKNLGLIIVDEEHDSSFKQSEPAPRYNGKDTALMLAKIHSAEVILGSATPSLESLFNCISGKYSLIELQERYYGEHPPLIEIVDTLRERRKGSMRGIFPARTIDMIGEYLSKGEQILIFRNRRSYSPSVQCIYCGDTPLCHRCNVPFSYHKKAGVLSCHYCGSKIKFSTICYKCSKPGLKERGSGTEMAEEQIRELFPKARVARVDGETAVSKLLQKRVLKEFAEGHLDILVGTQMLSKGFDFEKLTLIVVIAADSMFYAEDFRAEERGKQILTQLLGRGGRRDGRAHIIIQTDNPDNPVFHNLVHNTDNTLRELAERDEYHYPPFTRMVRIVMKSKQINSLEKFAATLSEKLPQWGIENHLGPFHGHREKLRGEHILNIWVKLKKRENTDFIKKNLYERCAHLVKSERGGVKLFFDVDPS